MRVVTRQDISAEKIDILTANMQEAVNTLESQTEMISGSGAEAFLDAEQSRLEYAGSGDYR